MGYCHVYFEPGKDAAAKLTQRQAGAPQVRSPDVIHGLGPRTENERPIAGSDAVSRGKTVISCEFNLLRGRHILNNDFAR